MLFLSFTHLVGVANKETDFSMTMVALQMGNRKPVLEKEDTVVSNDPTVHARFL